jgi:hypothetical protein
MSDTQGDIADDQANPALDEFVESVAKVNDGLSEMISCALRMQMLIMEDTRNMMAELSAVREVAGGWGTNQSDI